MVMINWRDVKPQIVHDAGIDFQLLKGQGFADPNLPTACMQGMYYVAYAMLPQGRSYHPHCHDDHEEVYYIIKGHGEMVVDEECRPIRDGDIIYIGKNQIHSICNTGEDDFIEFLAFASQC